MGKLKPYHHTIEVREIERNYRLTGEVTHSNFLNVGHDYSIPCKDTLIKQGIIKEGSKVKMTFFVDEDDVCKTKSKIRMEATGWRLEVWDDVSAHWSMISEEFIGDS